MGGGEKIHPECLQLWVSHAKGHEQPQLTRMVVVFFRECAIFNPYSLVRVYSGVKSLIHHFNRVFNTNNYGSGFGQIKWRSGDTEEPWKR